MNKLDLAEALIAIADHSSIQQAALKLHQTNAAISKKLTKLEAHLGTQLVHRERKGLTLTEAGQRYYHEAKKALTQFALAEQSVEQISTEPEGTLRIASNQHYMEKVILPKLPGFLIRYPKLKVGLDVAEILPDFNARKMDILFGVSAKGDDNLVRKKIDETRYVLCASPNYLKRKGKPNSSTELLQHDFIAHCARKSSDTIILDNDEQVVMKPKLFLNNTRLIIQAALKHLGIIWTHEDRVADLLSKKKLIRILDKYMQQPIEVYAYYERQPHCDPKIQAFMDFFVKQQ
jgi:DNA-binding transcriptional LysR family regulator